MPKYRKKEDKANHELLFEIGSGNVFLDIGFPEGEAINLLARSGLMLQIEDIIKERKWTQGEAAKFLGVAQPRVSDLMTHRIEKFTVDMLMKWLHTLGKQVLITVQDRKVT